MKPRLFRTILLAFSFVIVLSIVGMVVVGGLVFRNFWQLDPIEIEKSPQAMSAILADYYRANNESWAGVEQRLTDLSILNLGEEYPIIVLDALGVVVATSDRTFSLGVQSDRNLNAIPIESDQGQIGTLLLPRSATLPRFGMRDPDGFVRHDGPSVRFWPAARGFLLASVGLGGALLIMATVFARRLARPIQRITAAAQTLASGNLDVHVRDAPVRELHELTLAFNSMARALAQSDRQRRQMTADIAHELRTPLTIIKGRLEGLQDGVYAASPDQIQLLLEETALLERLIEDLRILALADAGQLPLYRELTDVGEILDAAVATFTAQAVDHGVELQSIIAPNIDPVDIDQQRIAQVFTNLIANALRHTPSGGTITLRATAINPSRLPDLADILTRADRKTGVLLQVCDTGQGIAADDLPHIFDRFWRAEGSRSRSSGGGGLGLAIARQLVLAHDGVIWAESTLGIGTTFSILLPTVTEEES